MIKFEITQEEIKILSYERFNHPHPRVQRKMEAVLLKSHNLPRRDICRITGISADTLLTCLNDYK